MIGAGFGHYGRTPESRKTVQEKANSNDLAGVASKERGSSCVLNNEIRPAVRNVCRYLGAITAVDSCKPPSLSKLRTEAYILTLPTGKQLELINRGLGLDGTALSVRNDRTLMKVARLLDEYNGLVNLYNQPEGTSKQKKKIVEDINAKLDTIDKTLADAVNNPGSGRSGAYQALRNSLRDTETLRGLRTDWRYWEMLGVAPAEYDRVADNPDAIEDWLDKGFSAKEALSFKNAGYRPDEVAHFKHTGITGPLARQLIQRGYTREFFEETLGTPANLAQAGFCLGDYHDAWAEDQGREFGSGAFNTVTARYFINQGHPSADAINDTATTKTERIFKPEKFVAAPAKSSDDKPAANLAILQAGETIAGVDNGSGLLTLKAARLVGPETLANPRLVGRNLASYRLARAFGTDVIVASEFALSTVPVSASEKKAFQISTGTPAPDMVFMPGIMMEKAEETCRRSPDIEPARPDPNSTAGAELYRNLTWLQLIDQVSGQIDRHVGNIRISAEGKIKGIDNDQCWAAKPGKSKDFRIMLEDRAWNLWHRETGYPRVVDEEMVARLCGFSIKELRQWKAGQLSEDAISAAKKRAKETLARAVEGCITKAETEAGQQRLDALQAYLLSDKARIIADWKTEYVAAASN